VKTLRVCVVFAAALAISCSQKKTADKKTDTPPEATPEPKHETAAVAAKSGWLTSYDQAQKEAQSKNRLLLMDFTGSDWCGWCIMLDKEVFSKPEFKEYAKKNLVLLEVDFPKMKKLPTETSAQNERLAQQFRIQAFPTVVVMDSTGKPIGALGYMRGGPEVFIAELEKLRKG
jgi:protein disulfide-isomerase